MNFPRRRHFASFLIGYCLFVIYGSLMPFEPRGISIGEAVAEYGHVLSAPDWTLHRVDLVVNVTLFVPLGFAGAAVGLWQRRQWIATILVGPTTVVLSVFFSSGVEFLQVWMSPRVSSPYDIAAHALGACVGVAAWLVVGRPLVAALQFYFGRLPQSRTVDRLLHAYVTVLIFLYALPLDPVEQMGHVYRVYRSREMWTLVPGTGSELGVWAGAHLSDIVLVLVPVVVWIGRLGMRHAWRSPAADVG